MKIEIEETVPAWHSGCCKFKGNGKEKEPSEQSEEKPVGRRKAYRA